jgi:predicted nucleic acid-binding protein
MDRFLVDTDVLIDISKGNADAADFLDNLAGDLFISRVATMELIIGAWNKKEQAAVENFIARFEVHEITESIGQQAYGLVKQLAKSHGMTLADALIAATALEDNLILVSRNEKHFRAVKGLKFSKVKY